MLSRQFYHFSKFDEHASHICHAQKQRIPMGMIAGDPLLRLHNQKGVQYVAEGHKTDPERVAAAFAE